MQHPLHQTTAPTPARSAEVRLFRFLRRIRLRLFPGALAHVDRTDLIGCIDHTGGTLGRAAANGGGSTGGKHQLCVVD